MHDPSVEAALSRGALVVTPNKRLAREIAARHDRAQVVAGSTTWPAARVLPWPAFLREQMQLAQDAGLAVPSLSLDPIQTACLWRRVVAADLADKPLVDVDAAAALAADAWELAHAYGAGLEGWRGFGGGEDVEAFVRWASAYRRETGRLDAIDGARAADVLAEVAPALPNVAALDVALAGFTELSPQQQRLARALASAGAGVAHLRDEAGAISESTARLVPCESSRDELSRALEWARAHALRDPDASIGVVVLDLAQRRAEVRAACEERLCAPLQWPGYHDVVRPYDLSLGPSLADVPLVASALALITLGERPIDRSRAAVLIRSPYLPGAQAEWMRRAALERRWLDAGTRALSWHALVEDLESVDKHLAARWAWARGELRREARLSPRAWVERWRTWLVDVAWCDDRALTSDEYQAQGAWNDLLGSFARLAAVAPMLSVDEALATLAMLAREQVFQPEAPGARIRVLGLLESTGLTFDALWVAGLAADTWPRAPQPNPLLPVAWQREHCIPRAGAEGELAFAREVTARWSHAAGEVMFSYAAAVDDHRRTASPLVAGLPRAGATHVPEATAERQFAQRPALQSVADARAPALAPGARLAGGTGVIEKQSDCPFRATAAHRLKAERWPTATIGVTPIERGQLVHATLDAFWRATRTQEALAAMSDETLAQRVEDAFEQSRGALTPARWGALPPAIAAMEGPCVTRLARQWLQAFERDRPAFEVVHTELRTTLALAGYTLEVRLDRVDSLATGGVAVIDYKTGVASPPARWFEARPIGMQAALYATAREAIAPEDPVQALVYAQLRPGEVKVVGLAADPRAWPGLSGPTDVKGAALADWGEARSRLHSQLVSLAADFGAGEAAVAPRDPKKVCALCGLRALCRIGAAAEATSDAEGADDE